MFPLPLSEVNELPAEAFENVFENVVEHAPYFAQQLSAVRPFASVENMIDTLTNILMGLSDEERKEVLNLYPDLADSARVAELSSESTREHVAAGLTELGTDQSTSIAELRARYRAKFGFPFVVCARESTPESIVSGLQQRLQRTEKAELAEGIHQVSRIAALRINDLVMD